MISDHMERYREAHDGTAYEVLRSVVVDGHEVAWTEYRGTVQVDITGRGREGEEFSGRQVMCECDFAEGVGWKREGGRLYSLDGPRVCAPRRAACHLRALELRREYLDRYDPRRNPGLSDGNFALARHVRAIIPDLMRRAEAGEWLGDDGGGAAFYGGYFYLQTVAEITDQYIGNLWEDARALCAEGVIGLEGAVVQPYREPPPPTWDEHARLEDDGWVGIAYLPGNRSMAREWKLEVLRPDGEPAYGYLPGTPLLHDPIFGPDAEDVERARRRLSEAIADAREREDG